MFNFKNKSLLVFSFMITACATVELEDKEKDASAKQFNLPSEGHAGLYIYRNLGVGTALKKDIRVNGDCVGESAPSTYFLLEVDGGKEHEISTESEFSPNKIYLPAESGKNYFVENYITLGLFVGGANLRIIDEDKAKSDIMKLKLARQGTCKSKQ